MCNIIDLDTIGYFLYMSEQESKEDNSIDNRSANKIISPWECKPAKTDKGVVEKNNPET